MKTNQDMVQVYTEMIEKTGFMATYTEHPEGLVVVAAVSAGSPVFDLTFPSTAIDEAHILYRQLCELLRLRGSLKEDRTAIKDVIEKLFASYRQTHNKFSDIIRDDSVKDSTSLLGPNPGKKLSIDINGLTYLRLPIRTRLITTKDTDILKLLDEYVRPFLLQNDLIFISEKVLSVTQGRIINMSEIKTTPLSRFLARNVKNRYGQKDFHGFGHGTDLAMQLLLEEVGYPRALIAAAVSALTRPLGIHGLFYQICGKRAKSIDCPMSFLVVEYAHFAKLAPNDPSGVARLIKNHLGHDVVVLDANYRGVFSLGKSTHIISEGFIKKLFKDNPLGQSDEMTPFCIVRRVT